MGYSGSNIERQYNLFMGGICIISKFEAHVGCEEWQESEDCSTYEEAVDYLKENEELGSYPATYMYIENLETGEIVDIL